MLFRRDGYIPTRYSPVCRSPCGALDLHVLSLPPAFVLSQDQTLKLENSIGYSDRTFDEVSHSPFSRRAGKNSKRRPSRYLYSKDQNRSSDPLARITPSTFLFLLIQLSKNPKPADFVRSSSHTATRTIFNSPSVEPNSPTLKLPRQPIDQLPSRSRPPVRRAKDFAASGTAAVVGAVYSHLTPHRQLRRRIFFKHFPGQTDQTVKKSRQTAGDPCG